MSQPKRNNPQKKDSFFEKIASILFSFSEKHWVISWVLISLSGIWYSLVLAFLGDRLGLITQTKNGLVRLSALGWILTAALILVTSSIKIAEKYHSSHNTEKLEVEDQRATADFFFSVCDGTGKTSSYQENSYIACIEKITNHIDDINVINYTPCTQVERIIENLRETIVKNIAERSTRFNDLYVGVAYNLPLLDSEKWTWCQNTHEQGLCIREAMSESASFYQLINGGTHERRVFYNSKAQAAADGLYIADSEDVTDINTGKLLGSIACYFFELKKNDITYIKIAIGISTYRNKFISESELPEGWRNNDLKNCSFIQNIDYIVNQYASLLSIELCKHYISKLQLQYTKHTESSPSYMPESTN